METTFKWLTFQLDYKLEVCDIEIRKTFKEWISCRPEHHIRMKDMDQILSEFVQEKIGPTVLNADQIKDLYDICKPIVEWHNQTFKQR